MKLKNKLILIIVPLIVLPIVVFRLISAFTIKDIFIRDKIHTVNVVIDKNFANTSDLIAKYKNITLLTSLYPPIQGIIRSEKTGTDPVDGSTINDWESRLTSIFVSQLKTLDSVYQIRYIDETGQERIKVDKSSGNIYKYKKDELQNKKGRHYFTETSGIDGSDVYISPVDLNTEYDAIQEPYLPTIRFATKIVSDADGSFKGIIVLNFKAESIFRNLETAFIKDTIILNEDGYYLSYKDQSKLFGFQLESGANNFSEQPITQNEYFDDEEEIFHDRNTNEYIVWKRFYYRKGDTSRYWIVVNKFSGGWLLELFDSWNQVFNFLIVVFVFLISLFAWFLADSIISPITVMSRIAEEGKRFKIKNTLKQRKDEIGRLARSIEKMENKMNETNVILDQRVKDKTRELRENMDDLEKFNQVMVGREIRMLELKKQINELSEKIQQKPPYDIGDYEKKDI